MIVLALFLSLAAHCLATDTYAAIQCATPLPYAKVADGFCAFVWASGLSAPRGVLVAPNNDVLVVEQSQNRITVLFEQNGVISRAILAQGGGLNHAIKIHQGYLYASSASAVYRWPYTTGQRTNLGTPQTVVTGIPTGGHATRSLELEDNVIYVQVGSQNNIDRTSVRSRISTFDVSSIPSGGYAFTAGKVYADGLRNEVGIRFDPQGQLWGVENGCDNLRRDDLGGDIHNDNPSEELNLLSAPGKFYGYPYCWSQFSMPVNFSQPAGSQWAHPDFIADGVHTDAWCKNLANVVPPAYNFPAHLAPMDIIWYSGEGDWNIPKGDAFVSFRGSWNRSPPSGYKVSHVKFVDGKPVSDANFLAYQGPGETGLNWPHRPVGLGWAKCGGETCLLVSSDASGVIIAIMRIA